VEGVTDEFKGVGHPFVLIGESLTPGLPFRLIETSIVVEVVSTFVLGGDLRRVKFRTENSMYMLDFLSEVDDSPQTV
jgi:hypothetical protein